MIFKILHIRSMVNEINSDPGRFAGNEARNAIIGILLVPFIIVILGLAFLFFLGFTNFLGGPYIFFKIIFFIGLFFSSIFFLIIRKLVSKIGNTTKKVVSKTIDNVTNKIE